MRLVCARDISVYDEGFLLKSLEKRLAETGAGTLQAYCALLRVKPSEGELFFSSLGISYSEFFRNPLTFSVLEQLVLPALISELERTGRKELRVWSAGCAAGQEAYSLAILLTELAARRGQAFSFRIFATDISETGLAAARAGVYDGAALKNVRLEHLNKYFSRQDGSYALRPEGPRSLSTCLLPKARSRAHGTIKKASPPVKPAVKPFCWWRITRACAASARVS